VAVADATMPLLAALIDASLVRRVSRQSGGRYALHELVRQYAADQLRADPDVYAMTTARHAAFFAARLHDHVEALQSGRQPETMDQLRPDLDNIWQAWAWAVQQPDLGMLRQMARGVVTLCEDLGSLQEGARLFGEAVAALGGAALRDVETASTLGDMLTRYGYFLGRYGQLVEGERHLRAALSVLPAHDDLTRGHALTQLALLGYQQGKFDEAGSWAQDAMTVLRIAEDQFYLGLATCFAGMITLAQGNYPEADAHLAESIGLWQANGYPRGLAVALIAQSGLALAKNQHRQAHAFAHQAVQLCGGQHDQWGMALALSTLGVAALALGDVTEACSLCDEGAEIARALGERWGLCRALLGSGWAMVAAEEHAAAGNVFREVVQLGRASALLPLVLHALLGLATLAFENYDVERALLYVAAIRQHRATEQHVRTQAETLWESYVAHVGTAAVMQVVHTAQDMPLTAMMDQVLRGR
jgi:tetratricopeptide (TPR) repeat protein